MKASKTTVFVQSLSLLAALLMLVVLWIDHKATACEKEVAKDVAFKGYTAITQTSAFMSLWATQFVAKEPNPHSPLGATAAATAESAQDAQKNFIQALTSGRCSSWTTANQWLIVAAFMLTTLTALGLRERSA